MPQAIPAAIGLGGSIAGGFSGKGAAKRQETIAREQMRQLQPLIEAIIQGTQASIGEGRTQIGRGEKLAGQSLPFFLKGLQGQEGAIMDLQNFFRPLTTGNRAAIDAFLSPERRAINQGYQAVQNNIARFAPRGGGRVAAGIQADVERQGKLSDLVFNARRAGAEGTGQVASQFGQLGGLGLQGVGQGFGGIGQGLQALGSQNTGALFSLLQNQQGLAAGAGQNAAANFAGLGKSLGDFLSSFDFFKGKKA